MSSTVFHCTTLNECWQYQYELGSHMIIRLAWDLLVELSPSIDTIYGPSYPFQTPASHAIHLWHIARSQGLMWLQICLLASVWMKLGKRIFCFSVLLYSKKKHTNKYRKTFFYKIYICIYGNAKNLMQKLDVGVAVCRQHGIWSCFVTHNAVSQ